jgi:acyl carrier protein
MNKEEILNRLNTICQNVFNDPGLMITETTNAGDIAQWDSVTNLFLIDTIEKEFSVKFSLDEIMNAEKIGDLCNIIEAQKK